MSHKVLLADDSLTIQKVIKITLAAEPYEIQECSNTEELMNSIGSNPDLIFLDFSLDDTLDGYELARQLKEKSPNSKILMLYGTFDTVDYEALNNSNVEANIVKPFDSNKFISICNDLVDQVSTTSSSTEEDIPEIITESSEEIDEDDNWTQENTAPIEDELPPVIEEDTELEAAANDWAQEDLPPVIEDIEEEEEIEDEDSEEAGDEEETKDLSSFPSEPSVGGFKNDDLEFPEIDTIIQHYDNDSDKLVDPTGEFINTIPKTEKPNHLEVVTNDDEDEVGTEDAFDLDEEVNLPDQSDLEYPDMSASSEDEDRKPQLVSLDELAPEEPREIEIDDLSFDTGVGTNTEEELENITMQLEDDDDDDLWSIDDGITSPIPVEVKKRIPSLEEQDMDDSEEVDEDAKMLTQETFETAQTNSGSNIDVSKLTAQIQSELEAKIASLVQEIVEEKVKEFCKSHVDRVAWEIIPELAENVVKKELAKISQSVMDDQ
jgi:CheY-like chemotaxis protein